MYKRDFEINEDQIADLLENALNKVKTTENVDTLAELSKLFKKNIPFSLRKYVIAYLLKESAKHYHPYGSSRFDRNDKNDRNSRSDRNERNSRSRNEYKSAKDTVAAAETTEEETPHHPRVEIPEDQATSIFIGIGKNRRVYPRDLVGILIAVVGLDRDRIGDIKVLANYSFVQLYTEDAQIAIDKLNGYNYRGRKLAVSYSKQKSEEDVADDGQPVYEDKTEADMAAEDAAAYAAAEKAAADKTPFGSN